MVECWNSLKHYKINCQSPKLLWKRKSHVFSHPVWTVLYDISKFCNLNQPILKPHSHESDFLAPRIKILY